MTILVDMDDVLEKLVCGWVAYLNGKYGICVKPEDVKDWDMTKAFPSLTREQVYDAVNDDSLWDYVGPMPGAVDGMRKLIEDGHDVYVVTASDYQTLRAKMDKVLFRYFPFISWEHVIITKNKHLICGDVLVDDGPHNLENGNFFRILYDAGHNRTFDESSIGAVRVHNWDEVYDTIKKMNSGTAG